jgi:hypothetical protein
MLRTVTIVVGFWGIFLLTSPLFLGPSPVIPRTPAELRLLRVVIVRPSQPYRQDQPCPAGFIRSWDEEQYRCYELADACPEGFQENRETGWRLCTIPDPFATPPTFVKGPKIAGIPYYEAETILFRHQQELMKPGILCYGLRETALHVLISDPTTVLPSHLEALPISVELCAGCRNFGL